MRKNALIPHRTVDDACALLLDVEDLPPEEAPAVPRDLVEPPLALR